MFMIKFNFLLMVSVVLCTFSPVQADTLVARLLASYEKIQTVTCDIRRDIGNKDGEMRWLSRVYYARPDRLHVENFAPLPRRIIADGQSLFQHNEGQPRGFRQYIDQLNEVMLLNVRKVPGTAMEHLFRISDAPEEKMEDGEGPYPIRRGYATPGLFVVLFADVEGRLGRIELREAKKRDKVTAQIDFESFEEVMDGVWIPMLHRGEYVLGDVTSTEVIRITNYKANEPIEAKQFDAPGFFTNVEWTSNFEDL